MADQTNVQIWDANGVKQNIGCVPVASWNGVASNLQAMVVVPWTYTLVTASGDTVIKASPGTIAAIINLDQTAAQAATISAYDNASAGTGTSVANVQNLADKVTWPPGGIAMTNGITINCSVAPTGEGVLILWS